MDSNNPQQSIQNPNPQNNQSLQPLQAPIQNLNQNQNQVQKKNSSNTKFILFGILIGVIVLILIITGIYFFLSSNKSNNLDTNSLSEINPAVDSNIDSDPAAHINIDEIDPHELTLELSEKGKKLEYVYYKNIEEDERFSGENWHYKKYWKIKPIINSDDLVEATIYVPQKGRYSIYGDEYILLPIDDENLGTYNDHFMGMYHEFLKDNDSLKLINVSKNEDNIIVYEFHYNDDTTDDLKKIWVSENGLFLKTMSVNDTSSYTVEYSDYSLDKFPMSIFDLPEGLHEAS